MLYELEIQMGAVKTRAFLQSGFSPAAEPTAHMHSHNYAELHLVSGGSARFLVGEETVEVADGALLAIPRETFHGCLCREELAEHTAFQLDCEVPQVALITLPEGLAASFLGEIGAAEASGDYERIAAYIALLCSYLEPTRRLCPRPLSDYGFLIHEFFSLHYKENIRLCDLARVLHLSERQTERLVLTHTGRTFRGELAHTRLTVADRLLRTSSMTLSEIAAYVGYESYAGFWKAMRRVRKEK